MYYSNLRPKAQPTDGRAEKPYSRRRKGEADDLPQLLNNHQNIFLTWAPSEERPTPRRDGSKRKRAEDARPVRAQWAAVGAPLAVLLSRGDAHLTFDTQITGFRDLFRQEFWTLVPLNPASMKMRFIRGMLVGRDHQPSSLSFSSLVMLSVANFLAGHWVHAKDLLHQAREHLEAIFDDTDYNLACALVPFTWFTFFYSDNPQQGQYYATLGRTICEQLGAVNDPVYMRLLWLLSFGGSEEEDVRAIVERATAHPPYVRNWKPLKNEPIDWSSPTHMVLAQVDGVIYHCADRLRDGASLDENERLHIRETLREQLRVLAKQEPAMDNAIQQLELRSFPLTYYMMKCHLLGQRVFILSMLESPKRLPAAETFILNLLRVPTPTMFFVLRTRPRNDVLLANAFNVLVCHQRLEPLQQLLKVLKPFTGLYVWAKSLRAGIKLAMMALACPSSLFEVPVINIDERVAAQPPPTPADQPSPYVSEPNSGSLTVSCQEQEEIGGVLVTDSDLRSYLPAYPVPPPPPLPDDSYSHYLSPIDPLLGEDSLHAFHPSPSTILPEVSDLDVWDFGDSNTAV